MTSNPHFKITIILKSNNSTNSKSCMIYPMVPFPMILSDPWPRFQGHQISWVATPFCFFRTKRYGNILTGTSNGGVERKAVWKNRDFWPISGFISELMLDRAIVTMEGKQKSIPEWYQFQWVCVASILDFKVAILSNCSLLNGAIFNDFEQLLTQLSRSHHSLTLNISETVRGSDTVTTKY